MPKIVTRLTSDNVQYALSLAKKHTEQIGFLPAQALAKYADLGGCYQIHQNDEPAGFLAGNFSVENRKGIARIYQAVIQVDAQRRMNGAELVRHFAGVATAHGCRYLTCWCRSELDANRFWSWMGFQRVGDCKGGDKRGARLIGWVLPIGDHAYKPTEPMMAEAIGCRRRRHTRDAQAQHQGLLFGDLLIKSGTAHRP